MSLGTGSRVGGLEVGFHDEGVLTRVVVVAAPPADDAEAEGFVEWPRFGVTRADLEDDELEPALSGLLEESPEQGPGEAPPAALRAHRDVGDVDFVGDLPQAQVADHALVLTHDPAAGHPILLHLVEEGAARPRHRERRALDAEDLVEVFGAHAVN